MIWNEGLQCTQQLYYKQCMSLQQLWLPYTVWQICGTFQNIFLRFSRYLTKFQADSQTTVNLCKNKQTNKQTNKNPFLKYFSKNFTNCIFHIQNIPHVCCVQAEKYAVYIKEQKRQQNEAFCKGENDRCQTSLTKNNFSNLLQKLMLMLCNRVSLPLCSSLISLPHALILLMSVVLQLLTEGSTYQHLKVIQMFMTVKTTIIGFPEAVRWICFLCNKTN